MGVPEIFRVLATAGKLSSDQRECCADAWLRLVSDSPPGAPSSCLVDGARCPFRLAQPAVVESARDSAGPGVALDPPVILRSPPTPESAVPPVTSTAPPAPVSSPLPPATLVAPPSPVSTMADPPATVMLPLVSVEQTTVTAIVAIILIIGAILIRLKLCMSGGKAATAAGGRKKKKKKAATAKPGNVTPTETPEAISVQTTQASAWEIALGNPVPPGDTERY